MSGSTNGPTRPSDMTRAATAPTPSRGRLATVMTMMTAALATMAMTCTVALAAPANSWAADDVADVAASTESTPSSSVVTTVGKTATFSDGTYWTSLPEQGGITPGQYQVTPKGKDGVQQIVAIYRTDTYRSGGVATATFYINGGKTTIVDVPADSVIVLQYPGETTWRLTKKNANYKLMDAGALVPRAGDKTYRVGNSGILSGTYQVNVDREDASQRITIRDVNRNVLSTVQVGSGSNVRDTQVVDVPETATYIELQYDTPTLWRKLTVRPAWKRVKDVTSKTPHHKEIMDLMKAGISTGWEQKDGSVIYGGMRTVVRQDMAAFLYRLAGSPAFDASSIRNPFTDVNEDTPHYKEILWLYANDIAKGYKAKDGTLTFGGMRTVVRQDMAAFLHRYADCVGADAPTGSAKHFKDVTSKTSHASDIAWLSKARIAKGYDNGTFGGMRDVVRQDMAAFLIRLRAFTN